MVTVQFRWSFLRILLQKHRNQRHSEDMNLQRKYSKMLQLNKQSLVITHNLRDRKPVDGFNPENKMLAVHLYFVTFLASSL